MDYLASSTSLRRQGDFLPNAPLIGKADTPLPTSQLTFRQPAGQRANIVLA